MNRASLAVIAAAGVLLAGCSSNGPSVGDKPPKTLSQNSPTVLAINACHDRIRGDNDEREPGSDMTTDTSKANRWIVKGEYTVKETGKQVDYTCTVTKTPGYDELSVDVPLTD